MNKTILLWSFLNLPCVWVQAQEATSLHYILTPRSSTERVALQQTFRDIGLSRSQYHLVSSQHKGISTIRFIACTLEAQAANQQLKQLQQSRLFEHVEPDAWGTLAGCSLATDPGFSLQWGLENDGSINNAIAGADISACEAWDEATGDSSIIVGFIDSGCKVDHEDLQGRVWKNKGEIPNNNMDDDGNGYIDDVYGWNTEAQSSDVVDHIGHGTQITGIVGANANNNSGFTGLDWHCQLATVKGVNDNGQGLASWWAEGIYYLVDNGAKIINLSLTIYTDVQALKDAVDYAQQHDVILVAAVGNADINNIGYPAKYPYVWAVGATNIADQRAVWNAGEGSNYGPEIDFVAPGQAIYGLNHVDNGLWYVTAGTSQATPLVTGLAALMLSLNPYLSIDSMRGIIRATADDEVGLSFEDVPGFDEHHGYGRVNAYEALKAVPDTAAPITSITPTAPSLSIHCHPNPLAAGMPLMVKCMENVTLQVFDATGKLVGQHQLLPGASPISIAGPPGLYALVFRTLKQQDVYTQKVLLTR